LLFRFFFLSLSLSFSFCISVGKRRWRVMCPEWHLYHIRACFCEELLYIMVCMYVPNHQHWTRENNQ
jgi:hypothetical protein